MCLWTILDLLVNWSESQDLCVLTRRIGWHWRLTRMPFSDRWFRRKYIPKPKCPQPGKNNAFHQGGVQAPELGNLPSRGTDEWEAPCSAPFPNSNWNLRPSSYRTDVNRELVINDERNSWGNIYHCVVLDLYEPRCFDG